MTFFGISEKDAEISRRKYGSNELLYRSSFGKALLSGINGLSCKLFVTAALAEVIAALTVFIGGGTAGWIKPAALFVIGSLCALFEAWLGYRSESTFNTLCASARNGQYAVFRENGKVKFVPKNMIAVGDAVFLSDGDEIPADGTVADGAFTVDQSVFGVIGKAEKTAPPQDLRTGGKLGINSPYFVFGGSWVCGGSGIMKVTAVGKNTRIAEKKGVAPVEAAGSEAGKTALTGSIIGGIAAAVTLVYAIATETSGLAAGVAHGAANAAAVLAVSCFCGKNLIYESAAARVVERLYKSGARVAGADVLKKAAETKLLLADRPGMFAEAEYSEKDITFFDGNGKEYGSFGKIDKRLGEVFKNAVICTSPTAAFSGGTAIGGGRIDRALYRFIGRKSENAPDIKVQAVVKSDGESVLSGVTVTLARKVFTFVRGGTDILLDRCTHSFGAAGKKQPITNKSALAKLSETLSAAGGKDLIALAVSDRGIKGGRLPSEGYTLIGLAALNNSFFDSGSESVERLEKAGAKTILVTSESRESAIYAAKKAGIKKGGGVVLDGKQLAKMSDSDLAERLDSIKAVVRAQPSDRRRLIAIARGKGLKVMASVSDPKEAEYATGAEVLIAAPGCKTAALQKCGAAAESCGIRAAADIVSSSAKCAADCGKLFVIRTVCAVLAAIAVLLS